MISVSAPGKIFLLGEYAVLEGYGALIGAVDRRVSASFTPDADVFRVASSLWPSPIDVHDLRLHGATSRVLAGVAAAMEFLRECELPRGTLRLDSSPLFAGGRKLGFGSSAAVVVAALGAVALAAAADISSASFRLRAFSLAKKWHNAAQGANGSGGDVAASLCGAVTFLSGDETLHALPPVGAMGVFVHPRAASTPSFVKALHAWADKAPEAYRDHMSALGGLTRRGVSALHTQNVQTWMETLGDADAALEALSQAADLPIVTPLHRTLSALVQREGGACKPAGAGGGDLSLVAARDEQHLAQITAALARENLALSPLRFSETGLRQEARRGAKS